MQERSTTWPDVIRTDKELAELLCVPAPQTVELMKRLEGDILVLGTGGKIGVSLARTAVRAIQEAGVDKRVVGVDLFPEPGARAQLEQAGIETITCDLLDDDGIASLPQVPNVIYMAGRKFGTLGSEELTWVMNVLLPAACARRFARSRTVVFSTGNVYPLVSTSTGGCTETHEVGPVGEYAQTCLGRERVYEYYSKLNGTPVCLFRLCYAVALRYGILHDIGRQVLDGVPVAAAMGHFNVIWQGDVNNHALLCLEHCDSPAAIMNSTGAEIASTREVARQFAEIMGRDDLSFAGEEAPVALINNAARSHALFGKPTVPLDTVIRWQAHWLMRGGSTLGKPTHFEVTNGKF